jgi:hypothetical protein
VALSPLELSETSGRLKEVTWSSFEERGFDSLTFRQANASRDAMVARSSGNLSSSSKWSLKFIGTRCSSQFVGTPICGVANGSSLYRSAFFETIEVRLSLGGTTSTLNAVNLKGVVVRVMFWCF